MLELERYYYFGENLLKTMPFKSKAQQKWMFAAEARGEVKKGTAERWAKHTKSIKSLPKKVKKSKKIKKAMKKAAFKKT